MTEITILIVVLLAAIVVGVLWRRREGKVRDTAAPAADTPTRAELLSATGFTGSGPLVLHFSADWCGPCVAVRRVVATVAGELAETARPPQDIEVDIDAEPVLARELNVLSLPTTFLFDAEGKERFRISGVPKAADLRTALAPLTV
ncbi:thioredoxin family protein [Nocardia sp. XZ_19_385]|uniref:thioredoxin family protein n=1 Tax=Nocardia sp. XZ_19_385 TaxID=2769488 RepID=UPI00188E004E|nr:thioredoxin family protein [Nocardia sp. XZ_19_385]